MSPTQQIKIDFEKELISKIQVNLMNMLKTYDIVYDVEGGVISEYRFSPYFKALQSAGEQKDLCLSSSWELSKNVIQKNKTFENVCPCSVKLIAAPICLGENIVVGTHCVAITNPFRSKFSVCDIASQYDIEAQILWDAVKKTPLIPKPILKIVKEQVMSTTDLMSTVLCCIYNLIEPPSAITKRYRLC